MSATASLRKRMEISPVAWRPSSDLKMEEWREIGTQMSKGARASNWWLGDWARFGYRQYGLSYDRAAQMTGYDAQTLHNMAWVAGRFNLSRRRESLSWSHHAEVAKLDEPDQNKWLARVESERLTIQQLRRELRRSVRGSKPAEALSAQAASFDGIQVQLLCPDCGKLISVSLGDVLSTGAQPPPSAAAHQA